MARTKEFFQQKFDTLLDIEGINRDAPQEALAEVFLDSVVPGICLNPECECVEQCEPDATSNWCSECETNSVMSIMEFLIQGASL